MFFPNMSVMHPRLRRTRIALFKGSIVGRPTPCAITKNAENLIHATENHSNSMTLPTELAYVRRKKSMRLLAEALETETDMSQRILSALDHMSPPLRKNARLSNHMNEKTKMAVINAACSGSTLRPCHSRKKFRPAARGKIV